MLGIKSPSSVELTKLTVSLAALSPNTTSPLSLVIPLTVNVPFISVVVKLLSPVTFNSPPIVASVLVSNVLPTTLTEPVPAARNSKSVFVLYVSIILSSMRT